jgi:hypothetical protein
VLDRTGSGLSPLSGIGSTGVEPLDSAFTGVVVYYGLQSNDYIFTELFLGETFPVLL